MFVLVAYDIADHKRLQRIAKIMEDYGDRVQYSVFEVEVDSMIFRQMKQRTEDVMDENEDGVKYFFLCERCAGRIDVVGLNADRTEQAAFRVL
ncbi:MAG: CRISPR-associated endonuclease Cas2 [Desulfohalobiaceae bacterium]|nr:CRISPR-associated endonuclease Cas2 [Desulfohalobiaceae bacterium]